VDATAPVRARATRQRLGWMAGGAVAGGVATLFAWTIGTSLVASRAGDDFALAAVATHGRAALANQLIQVASSDRHTVKPWLSARLDYSPPVVDLASEGFPLVGGRIDTIDARPVATLVYRLGLHTVDVFVRPREPDRTPGPTRSVRGFNVVQASGRTMEWLAVSDAEVGAVTTLVQRLAREDGAQ
jgi:anti-sigma factor RsiW